MNNENYGLFLTLLPVAITAVVVAGFLAHILILRFNVERTLTVIAFVEIADPEEVAAGRMKVYPEKFKENVNRLLDTQRVSLFYKGMFVGKLVSCKEAGHIGATFVVELPYNQLQKTYAKLISDGRMILKMVPRVWYASNWREVTGFKAFRFIDALNGNNGG